MNRQREPLPNRRDFLSAAAGLAAGGTLWGWLPSSGHSMEVPLLRTAREPAASSGYSRVAGHPRSTCSIQNLCSSNVTASNFPHRFAWDSDSPPCLEINPPCHWWRAPSSSLLMGKRIAVQRVTATHRSDRRQVVHRPLAAHPGDQSRPGHHLRPNRLRDRRKTFDRSLALLWSGSRESRPSGEHRHGDPEQEWTAALFTTVGSGLPAIGTSRDPVPFR